MAGSCQRLLAWAMMPSPVTGRYPPLGGSASTCRSRARSTLAHPRSTAAAATSSGIPARVMADTAAVAVAVKVTANRIQPTAKT